MPGIRAGPCVRSRDLPRPNGRISDMNRREFVLAAAGAALSVRGSSAFGSLLGGTPLAYVTADLESHVVALDLGTARVVDRIRTGPGPRSIEAVRGTIAVVAHTEHGVVSLLDARGRLRTEVERFAAPRYTAVHPRLPYAYVTDSEREEIVVLDADRGRVLWRTAVPGPARHISLGPDGRTLWAALGTTADRVAILDVSHPRRPRLRRTLSPPFLAHDVVFSPRGYAVWVTSGDSPELALYSLDGRVRRVIAAGAPPQHVAFGSEKAFVASGDDGTVRRHRLDGSLVREVRVPVGSYNVTFDPAGGRVVSPSLARGTISVLDRNGRVQAVQRVARAAHDSCVVIGP
jgi:DNA-binding beta-propeller fold protein YncE